MEIVVEKETRARGKNSALTRHALAPNQVGWRISRSTLNSIPHTYTTVIIRSTRLICTSQLCVPQAAATMNQQAERL